MHRYHAQNDPDLALARAAADQDGVVDIAQLYALGFSYEQVRQRVRRGRLHEIYRGVYAVGHRRLTIRGWLRAALLAGGAHAFLSHRTAAAVRCGGRVQLRRIELTVPSGHTPPRREPGLVFHRTTNPIDPREVSPVAGLAASTIPRILVELSRQASEYEIRELLAESVRTAQFDPEALEAAIQRHSSRPGVRKLKRIADYYRPLPDCKSEFEREWDREHARRPEIPPCERNVKLGIWEVDCHWPEQRVALELDGRRFHSAQQDFERDRRKDTALQLLHQKPMRAGYWMWKRDKEEVIGSLLKLLAL